MKETDFPINSSETTILNADDTTLESEEITPSEQDEITSDEIYTLETDEESTKKEDKSSSTNASQVSAMDREEELRRILSGFFIFLAIFPLLVVELIFFPMFMNDDIQSHKKKIGPLTINLEILFFRVFYLSLTATSPLWFLALNPECSDSIENMLSTHVSYKAMKNYFEIIRNWWKC